MIVMTFMRKILDALNMENWDTNNIEEKLPESNKTEREQILSFLQSKIEAANKLIEEAKNISDKTEFDKCVNEIMTLFSELSNSKPKEEHPKENNPYDKYYENIRKQRESNLNISYDDIKAYDMKPFDLKGTFISDGAFTAIELSGKNLDIAYGCLKEINRLLYPHEKLYEDTDFPEKISTEYELSGKLPISHLRLIPYTATMRKSKYPLCLWLSNVGYYGTEYIYAIYYDRDGNIGQCELSLHGFDGVGISYETKVRRNDYGLYILRISKTLYSPPYGTTTIYHCRDNENTEKSTIESNTRPKSKRMSKNEIEQYAKECNAYAIREDRKEQQ